jgi:hypothetical protein
MTDDPTRTEPAYFGTPEQLLNALTEMQRRETRIQERAILCAALEALIDKPAPAPDKVGYSQAKRDLCLFLDPDLASADAWGWDDDSVFAAALARLTTPSLTKSTPWPAPRWPSLRERRHGK